MTLVSTTSARGDPDAAVCRLHAPLNTTVECVLKAGVVAKLVVTPASRRADVAVAPLQG